jgi:hypothetical protein
MSQVDFLMAMQGKLSVCRTRDAIMVNIVRDLLHAPTPVAWSELLAPPDSCWRRWWTHLEGNAQMTLVVQPVFADIFIERLHELWPYVCPEAKAALQASSWPCGRFISPGYTSVAEVSAWAAMRGYIAPVILTFNAPNDMSKFPLYEWFHARNLISYDYPGPADPGKHYLRLGNATFNHGRTGQNAAVWESWLVAHTFPGSDLALAALRAGMRHR